MNQYRVPILQEDNHRKLLKYDMLHVNVSESYLIYYDLCRKILFTMTNSSSHVPKLFIY